MPDGYDLLAVIGLGVLGAGLVMVSVPLALVVTGSFLMVVGLLGAWRKGGRL